MSEKLISYPRSSRFCHTSTPQFIDSPAKIADVLGRHLHSKVPWKDSVQKLISEGSDQFIEVGPGSALTRMVKWINRTVKATPAQDILLARV